MGDHVFISHSSQDRRLAGEVCRSVEDAGFPCWIADRDAAAGLTYGSAIIDAIRASWLVILVLTPDARRSQFVEGEVERAFANRVRILTVRIGEVTPSKGLELFVAGGHWFTATDPLTAADLDRLGRAVRTLRSTPPPGATAEHLAPPRVPPPPDRAAGDRSDPRWHRTALKATAALAVTAGIGVLGAKGSHWLRDRPGEPTLTLMASRESVFVGDTFSVEATFTGGVGGATPAIRWSSDNPAVVESGGRASSFTALSAGVAVLRGEANGARDSLRVTVRQGVASMRIEPPPSLHPGDSLVLTLEVEDASGRSVEPVPTSWSSNQPKVISVDASTGMMRARTVGHATVEARYADRSTTVDVSVVDVPQSSGAGVAGRKPEAAQQPPTTVAAEPRAPTATQLAAFADQCLAALRARDTLWVADHYHPGDASDHEHLRSLLRLLAMPGFQVVRQEVDAPDVVGASVAFRTDVKYKRPFGGSAETRASFHVSGEQEMGKWRLAHCRVDESPALR